MNILLFVITMILLLTTMTYTKLELFLSHQLLHSHFEKNFQSNDELFFKNEAKARYKSFTMNTKEKKPSDDDKPDSNQKSPKGISKLSWNLFFSKTKREQNPGEEKELIEFSKALILSLFEKQQTVKKLIEEDSSILDRFFTALMDAVEKLPEKSKIKQIKQLANLQFEDDKLKDLSYELLKKNPIFTEDEKPKDKANKQNENDSDKNKQKTYSLLDELTLKTGKTRLYLASRNLLRVLVKGNEKLVDEICEKRKALHKQANKKPPPDGATLASEFEAFFDERVPSLNKSLFEFQVTTTDPTQYE